MRDWWERWGNAVAIVVALLTVVGTALVISGVVRLGAPTPSRPAPPVPAAPARPVAPPQPARPPADSPTAAPPSAAPDLLAVQPGGPAIGAPTDDRVVHTFGPRPVGTTSPALVLAVTNPLAYAVEVREVMVRSTSFGIRDDVCTGALLQPRTTCRLTVVFAPTAAGLARSPVAVRLREVCSSSRNWPCDAGEAQIRSGVPDGARTVLPSGQVAVDWTTILNDGVGSLWVEGTTS